MIRTVVVASTLYQIETFLRSSLSRGELCPEAHTSLAPSSRRARQPGMIPRVARPAAALVLLYPIDQQIHLILTRRAGTLDQHAGQISLPGGALNELDVGLETIEAAALRDDPPRERAQRRVQPERPRVPAAARADGVAGLVHAWFLGARR